MHPVRSPRNAIALGVLFVTIGLIYWVVPYLGGWHVDYSGMTMLIALGAAMGIMAYVLIAGAPND